MAIYNTINEDGATLGKGPITKTFTDSYLYNKADKLYSKDLIDFLMKGEPIDKTSEAFEDIKYDVKRRQVSDSLLKVLMSNLVVIMDYPIRMPKAFTVFMAKDLKDNNKSKVFIYNDSIIKTDSGLKLRNPDVFVAHLVNAMNQVIYYVDPKRIILNGDLTNYGAKAFSKLFTNVIDFLFKIGSIGTTKGKVLYLSALYYIKGILKKDITDSSRHLAENISQLTDRDITLLEMQFDFDKDFLNINTFIEALAKNLNLSKLTIDTFLERWIYLYGTGTQFALELYPSFAAMLTNAFVGCYINNQKTIEKLVADDMVAFSQAILRIGKEVV